MPNGYNYDEERHGPHDYGEFTTGLHDCKYGCGCHMASSTSGGPAGLDPFGECPGNPIAGRSLGNLAANTDFVITRRVRGIEARMNKAEDIVKRMRSPKKQLAADNEALKSEIRDRDNKLLQIQRILDGIH